MRLYVLFSILATIAKSQIDYCTGQPSVVGHCTTETYIDTTFNATNPTTTSECQDTCRGILDDAGDWIVDFTGQPPGFIDNMVGYPCGFSIGRGPGEPNDYSFSMANQDIVDILDQVSKQFGSLHGGKVAAQGTMDCDGHQATWYVK